jgi:hypothetical protein
MAERSNLIVKAYVKLARISDEEAGRPMELGE